jgi:hypothetical protein
MLLATGENKAGIELLWGSFARNQLVMICASGRHAHPSAALATESAGVRIHQGTLDPSEGECFPSYAAGGCT